MLFVIMDEQSFRVVEGEGFADNYNLYLLSHQGS